MVPYSLFLIIIIIIIIIIINFIYNYILFKKKMFAGDYSGRPVVVNEAVLRRSLMVPYSLLLLIIVIIIIMY